MTETTAERVMRSNGPQLVELHNELCAVLFERTGETIKEVTRFANLDVARRRCKELGARVDAAAKPGAVDEPPVVQAEEPQPGRAIPPAPLGRVEDVRREGDAVVGTVKGLAPPVKKAVDRAKSPALDKPRPPRFTLASLVRVAGPNPYEEGTQFHDLFKTVEDGMTVKAFCEAHGKYPRALNFLNPMLRDGAVRTQDVKHGVAQ